MSVQLLLFPQIYEGISTTTFSGNNSECITNGQVFSGVDEALGAPAAENYYGNFSGLQALYRFQQIAPIQSNQWYIYRNGILGAGTPFLAYPVNVNGNLEFVSQAIVGNGYFGTVFQKMDNLVVGQQYEIKILSTEQFPAIGPAILDGIIPSLAIWNSNQGGQAYSGTGTGQMGFVPQTNNTTLTRTTPVQPGFVTSFLGPVNTFTFTAQETSQILSLTPHQNDGGLHTTTVTSISVRGSLESTTTFTPGSAAITNGQVICDLYEDEAIPLTFSIDDFKNVAEKVQSYSKAFKLPGTKRNNQIFENIFDVTRTAQGNTTFNPYGRTKCELKQDGFILFEGYMRLLEIQDKGGEISYNINLYSEVVAFADLVGEATFGDMDFSELLHDYNKTSIKNSWYDTTGLPLTNPLPISSFAYDAALGASNTNVLKYPFVDWTHQMLIANGATGTTATAGNPELTLLEQAFRPFVQAKYLIDRIFGETDFSYTSNFIDSAEFGKLFMDFNWGENPTGAAPLRDNFVRQVTDASNRTIQQSIWTTINVNTAGTPPGNTALWDNTNFRFISDVNSLACDIDFKIQIENIAFVNTWSVEMRICKFDGGGNVLETFQQEKKNIAPLGSVNIQGVFSTSLNSNEYIEMQAKTFNSSGKVRVSDTTESHLYVTYQNVAAQTDSLLNVARGGLKQWDFFKGIMTMFNLVTIPDKSDPNNILIEPYGDIFVDNPNSQTLDWTEKIDIEEIKLKPLVELNQATYFKFEEDGDDYSFNVYKNSVPGNQFSPAGHLYGSMFYDASISSTGLVTLLSGSEEITASPFAATICKRLMPQYMNIITPAIYSYDAESGESQGFKNLPRLLFNNGRIDTGIDYYIPAQNGLTGEVQDEFLQFTHLTDIPTVTSNPPVSTDTNDFHFGVCQLLTGLGQPTANNLFSLYWEPYFRELYNPDTRIMTLKVHITPGDINTLNLFDVIYIKNRAFRINKIDYKPNDLAVVEFILVP